MSGPPPRPMPPRRRHTLVTLVVAALVALPGCSNGDQGSNDRADTVPETTTTTPATTPATASPATAQATTTTGALTPAQARAALLALDDMETGWTTATASPPRRYSPPRCSVVGDWPSVSKPATRVAARFTNDPEYGRYIVHVVASWPTPAGPFLAAYRQAVADCPTYTRSGARIRTGPLSFPNLGDATFAYRENITVGSDKAVVDIVVVALGNSVSVVAVGDYRPMPGAELENLVQITVDRLRSVR